MQLRRIPCLILLLLGASGCGSSLSTVSGKVTWEGKPLIYGMVTLVAQDHVPFTGAIQPDGTYVVKDVPYGVLRVTVSSPAPPTKHVPATKVLSREMKNVLKEAPKPATQPPSYDRSKWFRIPEKYSHRDTSELTLTLQQPTTTFDIPLP